jgi:hypothetical protein
MTQTPTTKCCTKCGIEYPATKKYFPPKKDGFGSWCRGCLKLASHEYKQKNKEAIAAAEKARYNKNVAGIREKKRIANREYYRKLKKEQGESVREYKKNWQKNKREKIKEVKTNAIESDDYSDLLPANEHDWYRSWAVITSWEYAAHFNRKTGMEYPEEKEN